MPQWAIGACPPACRPPIRACTAFPSPRSCPGRAPARSEGGTRRYSADDLARLQRITELVAAGVNLAGVARILDLEDDNAALRAANIRLKSGKRTRSAGS